MSETNQALILVSEESVRTLSGLGPQIVADNQRSVANCNKAGKAILDTIEGEGLNDELDAEAKIYIDKAKRTVKVMNERRSPITKLFDQIRSEFVAMENSVDPSRQGSIAYRIQKYRNEYAAKKREEEERKRREEMLRQQRQSAIRTYTIAVEENYKNQLNELVIAAINDINRLDAGITLDNIDLYEESINNIQSIITEDDVKAFRCTALVPSGLSMQECQDIQRKTLSHLTPKLIEQYQHEVCTTRDEVLDRLPSKRKQLQRAAEASAEEAARIKAEMAAREAEEAKKREEERLRKEQDERAKHELASRSAEMDGLFESASLEQVGYTPKTSVKLKIVPQSPEAFMHIVSLWWSREGQNLPIDKLTEIFRRQITFCERLANSKDNPEEISHPSVQYVEDVKAK